MNKLFILIFVALFSTGICLPQSSDSGNSDPRLTCQAFFYHYLNDSIETFVEAYPYRFVDQSVGNIYEWTWDFGDGTGSHERNPIHLYPRAGDSVLVCLTIKTVDTCTSTYCQWMMVGQRPVPPDECKALWQANSEMPMGPDGQAYGDSSNSPLARNYLFRDMSKGPVVHWHWDFGDGASSTEQSPVHRYGQNGVFYVCLNILTANQCSSSYCDTLRVGAEPYCNLTGTVVDDTTLAACGLIIKLDNGEVLEPVEVDPNFVLRNGQRVRLAYTELTDRVSACMLGKIVRIDCIQILSTGYCAASFTHYSLSWISSLPPIYQFVDQSAGDVISKTWDLGDGTVTNEYGPSHRYRFSGLYTVCLTIYTADGCTSTRCETAYYEGANPQTGLCDNLIRLTTEIILNGQICDGSATATLVNKYGQTVYADKYLWSTGETGSSVSDLCPGTTYSVIVIDSSGCVVSGSFSFGGSGFIPDSLIGFWNFEQYDKSFLFTIPVFSDSIRCVWNFGDGDTASGSSVHHTYSDDHEYKVALHIYDQKGNLIFTQEIPVTPGTPTTVNDNDLQVPEVYPVPAGNTLFIRQGARYADLSKIEVISSGGQVLNIRSFNREPADRTIEVDVSSLTSGFYIGRLIYQDGTQSRFRFVK